MQTAGEYWWQQKYGHVVDPTASKTVTGKNFSSASFAAPDSYRIAHDPACRANFARTITQEAMSASRHFTSSAGGESVDGKFTSASFAPTAAFVAENAPRYEPWQPTRFWGYTERK